MDYLVIALSFLLGGAWRRWEGQHVDGFLGHRWLKLTVLFLLSAPMIWYWVGDVGQACVLAVILTAGWTDGAQFGRIDNDFTWPLLARYGAVSFVAALVAAILQNDITALAYAPVGLIAPLGYTLGKWTNRIHGCWTCVGEFGLGAVIYSLCFLLNGV